MIEKDEQVAHISWLVPVPLHRTRLRERGYNQSDFVTQGISTITKLPIQTGILERTRNTRSQTKLSQDERAVNMRDVFRVTDRAAVKNQRIGLVDDVMTTGSTFDSCAGALLEAGAEKVFALAIARA
ncbi:MAG: ComF family protein [Candidatus Latescibacteria bacterium]|nr:ComF family protein [Candidatus Latescibacterota bacterium]